MGRANSLLEFLSGACPWGWWKTVGQLLGASAIRPRVRPSLAPWRRASHIMAKEFGLVRKGTWQEPLYSPAAQNSNAETGNAFSIPTWSFDPWDRLRTSLHWWPQAWPMLRGV